MQCGVVQASNGSHLCMGIPQFLPHNSAALEFPVLLMSMQMDAECKKVQIGTLLFGWGHWKGGLGGGVVPQGCPPQKLYMPSKKNSWYYSECK